MFSKPTTIFNLSSTPTLGYSYVKGMLYHLFSKISSAKLVIASCIESSSFLIFSLYVLINKESFFIPTIALKYSLASLEVSKFLLNLSLANFIASGSEIILVKTLSFVSSVNILPLFSPNVTMLTFSVTGVCIGLFTLAPLDISISFKGTS